VEDQWTLLSVSVLRKKILIYVIMHDSLLAIVHEVLSSAEIIERGFILGTDHRVGIYSPHRSSSGDLSSVQIIEWGFII
jgi:hypothetical protein